MAFNAQSYSYSYYSSSTSVNGGPPQSTAYAERSYTDNTGTRTERVHKLPGQQPVYECSGQPATRRVAAPQTSTQGRIVDVTDAEKEYEERMEDEYAKREGGA